MTVTFDDAVQAARDFLATDPQFADLVVGDYGTEDQTAWAPATGLPAAVLDGDRDAIVMDAPILLVDKSTGVVTEHTFLDDPDRFSAMRPVGTPPEPKTKSLTDYLT